MSEPAIEATADLVDHYGEALASIPVQFRSFGRRRRFAGPGGDGQVLRGQRPAEVCAVGLRPEPRTGSDEGPVLVVDGGGSLRSALVGDVIAAIAVERGWAGLVVYGCVRDSVALDALDLGIKALGTNPRKSGKTGAGVVGEPVEIGGVWIRPGQRVVSDEDGIVVLPVG